MGVGRSSRCQRADRSDRGGRLRQSLAIGGEVVRRMEGRSLIYNKLVLQWPCFLTSMHFAQLLNDN